MDILNVSNEKMDLLKRNLIEPNKNFIMIFRQKEKGYVTSMIVKNDRIKFCSSNNPSISVILDIEKNFDSFFKEYLNNPKFNTVVFGKMKDTFNYKDLIKFSEEYDKYFSGSSTKFYKQYKEQIKNIFE